MQAVETVAAFMVLFPRFIQFTKITYGRPLFRIVFIGGKTLIYTFVVNRNLDDISVEVFLAT